MKPMEAHQFVDDNYVERTAQEALLKRLEEAGYELTLVQPDEPEGEGYIYIAVVLHNGAEAMAKRGPNRHWWWEALPCSGPNHKKSGSWNDLLDHYGRTLPLTVVRLERQDEAD